MGTQRQCTPCEVQEDKSNWQSVGHHILRSSWFGSLGISQRPNSQQVQLHPDPAPDAVGSGSEETKDSEDICVTHG